jgi:serine/threonine-protein kinase
MGRVYLAQDTRLNRHVALKILSPERVNNPRAIARFQREARVGAQLQHENLVRIYDFGESNGRYYLVMEYIEGETIGTMLTREIGKESNDQETKASRLPPAIAAGLARQVAMGLSMLIGKV